MSLWLGSQILAWLFACKLSPDRVGVNSLILCQGMRAGVNEGLRALPSAQWGPPRS